MAETHVWVSADGTATPMDSTTGVTVRRAVKGRIAPTYRTVEDLIPQQPGSRMRAIQHDARTVTLPVTFRGADAAALFVVLRAWEARFDPTRGPSRWRVTTADGTTRELSVYVTAGMDLDESEGVTAGGVAKTALTLRAAWPYWQPAADEIVTFAAGTPVNFFPGFPFHLSGSQVFGGGTLTNTGDEDAWPVWVLTGPCTSVVLKNLTTSRVLAWSGTLGVGETLTVDTRPAELSATPKSVTRGDGTDEFVGLAAWDFWPVAPGSQLIDIEMDDSGPATGAQLSFRANLRSQ